jgi:hypothetical protein
MAPTSNCACTKQFSYSAEFRGSAYHCYILCRLEDYESSTTERCTVSEAGERGMTHSTIDQTTEGVTKSCIRRVFLAGRQEGRDGVGRCKT